MTITIGNGAVIVSCVGPAAPAKSARAPIDVIAAPSTQWNGNYLVSLAGKTDDEIAAEIAAKQAHHDAKSGRMNALVAVTSAPLVVGGVTFTWGGTIREKGTDCEVVLWARPAADPAAKWTTVDRVYSSIDAIPDDATITAIVTSAIAAGQKAISDAAAQVGRLQARLGGLP